MYTYEFRFYPLSFSEPSYSEFFELMQSFISSLVLNGQILEMYQNTVKHKDHFSYRVVAPEKNSLSKELYNIYCLKYMNKISKSSKKEMECIFIGENADVSSGCMCEFQQYYILSGDRNDAISPIMCGNCQKSVPLYKMPKTYDNEEYYDVISWQRLYSAFDTQFMKGTGERHGYKMLNSIKSPLTIEGRRICEFLEGKTGKPFYYFLFKYYTKNKSSCPSCGGNWVNQSEVYDYSHVCDTCRLVSDDIV